MSDWISCEDKTPKFDGEYLIFSLGKIGVATYWKDIGKWLGSDVRFEQGDLVTHWQALPNRPEQ
jgi:hypothetical protein